MLELTKETYHSIEAQIEYLSASRYLDFAGCLGKVPCEARAMAQMHYDWIEEPSAAMLMSSYVDAHFSGHLETFKVQNPSIFTNKKELKAQYLHAEKIIQRIESDEYFMKCLSGQKQLIMTAELFGAQWSIMIDSYIEGVAAFDLKVMADLSKAHYVKDWGRMSFIQYYGYIEQAAIYQAVIAKVTGQTILPYIAAASKEEEPDIEVIGFYQDDLDAILEVVGGNIPRILKVKSGEVEPDRCQQCAYCRKTKVLSAPRHFSELILKV